MASSSKRKSAPVKAGRTPAPAVAVESAELLNLRGQLAALNKGFAVIECQPDGTLLTANENFLRLTGYELAELQGQRHEVLSGSADTALWEKLARGEQEKVPVLAVFRSYAKSIGAGILVCLSAFVLFYLMTVFTLSWGTSALGYTRGRFLQMQLLDISLFAITIPVSALLAERGRRRLMLWVNAGIVLFGFILAPLFVAGTKGTLLMMAIGLSLMGLTYAPLGTVISELFPTPVRYTGSSLAFSLAGILGASLAPYAATSLAKDFGLQYVGYYLSASALLTMIGLLCIRETKDDNLSASPVPK